MSTNYLVSDYTEELDRRLPIGMTDRQLLFFVNLSWQQIAQLAPLTFFVERSEVLIPSTGIFDLPSDFDVARPAVLQGVIDTSDGSILNRLEIPFVPVERIARQNATGVTVPRGLYTAWTFYQRTSDTTTETVGMVVPVEACPATAGSSPHAISLIYHKVPSILEEAQSIPIPASFEWLLVDMAEAEARRFYGMAGQDLAEARVQRQLQSLLDAYRTTKVALAGIADQTAQAQQIQAKKVG